MITTGVKAGSNVNRKILLLDSMSRRVASLRSTLYTRVCLLLCFQRFVENSWHSDQACPASSMIVDKFIKRSCVH